MMAIGCPPPMDCPAALYQLMLDCLQKDRNKRPKFEQIVSILDKLIRNPSSLKIIANTASRPSNVLLDRNSTDVPSFHSTGDWLDNVQTLPCKDAFSGLGYSSCDSLAKASAEICLSEIRPAATCPEWDPSMGITTL